MAALTEEQKRAIVLGFADFMSPAAIRVMIKETYDLELEYAQITMYDPTRPNFQASDRWRTLYEEARKKYVDDTLSVPIAGQGFRLRSLQKMHDKAFDQGNMVLAAEILKQAAQEVGGLLTNVRNENRNQTSSPLLDLTPGERRQQAVELLREALAKRQEDIMKEAGTVTIEHQPKEGT